jgi:hypothetical protein
MCAAYPAAVRRLSLAPARAHPAALPRFVLQFAGAFLLRAIGQHEWWTHYYPNIEGVGNDLMPSQQQPSNGGRKDEAAVPMVGGVGA